MGERSRVNGRSGEALSQLAQRSRHVACHCTCGKNLHIRLERGLLRGRTCCTHRRRCGDSLAQDSKPERRGEGRCETSHLCSLLFWGTYPHKGPGNCKHQWKPMATASSRYHRHCVSATYLRRRKDRIAKDALELLSLLAFLHFEGVTETIFEKAWESSRSILTDVQEGDDQRIWKLTPKQVARLPSFIVPGSDQHLDKFILGRARSQLASLSIVSIDSPTGMMRMHPVTHLWARYRFESH